ncbi:MotA/TolQ/ExbB proton channel family protein [Desulfohalobium retbaense]|uniref:MotA/TolQ/ExbB proton channel n=1 Tax=Desulfohalobium retbaense (strain ATCC 49708 / DSM 5692 / JCM 16813 / HR100) TaxID=485915 RepID=C8X3E1_DESRD|nr:MotA/TolQ/ExbB proton channel family protein [Desulfohalobium retbaense]ACV68938.1 MotA/TolQ/ExbB proton channel [Desulfohalobium retbaense DSM 5692]
MPPLPTVAKRTWALFGLLAVLIGIPVCAAAGNWTAVRETLVDTANRTEDQARLTSTLVQQDKTALHNRLESLQKRLREEQAALEANQASLTRAKDQLEAARREQSREQETIRQIKSALSAAAGDLRQQLDQSALGAEIGNRPLLDRLEGNGTLASMQDINALVSLFFSYIERSGEVQRFKDQIITSDGSSGQADIVLAGPLTGFYRTAQGKTGFLSGAASEGSSLQALPASPSWFTARRIGKFFDDETNVLPLDLTGRARDHLRDQDSWRTWIRRGGVFIWPLLAVAGVALLLALERGLALLRLGSPPPALIREIADLASRGSLNEAIRLCQKQRGKPACLVLGRILERAPAPRQAIEDAQHEAILNLMPRLERFLPTLQVLAAIAPLLGLLGTVTGMIGTFQTITIFGTGKPEMMAGGISEALLTTQFGLAIAIPLLLVHHLFDRRVERIVADCEETGATLILGLQQGGAILAEDSDGQ